MASVSLDIGQQRYHLSAHGIEDGQVRRGDVVSFTIPTRTSRGFCCGR
jgi:hypothetical protein